MRTPFSIGIGLIYAAYTVVRIRAERSASARRTASAADPGAKRDALELAILTALEVVILALWMFRAPFLASLALALPAWIRFLGLALGACGVALIAWAGEVLDGEYSSVVEFKPEHRLITRGPYARIRHPIYAGLGLMALGVPLASANALVALVWPLGLALVLVHRIKREESLMEARFGDDWRAWRDRTGRFLPRMGRRSEKAR